MEKHLRIWIAVALLLPVAVAISGCGKSVEEQIQEQLELGQRYLTEMNYEEAIVAFQKVIELDPKNIDGYRNLGDTYEVLAGTAGSEAGEEVPAGIAGSEAGEEAAAGTADSGTGEDEYYRLAMEAFEKVMELDAADSHACERLLVIYKYFGDLDKLRHLLETGQETQSGETETELSDLKTCLELIQRLSDLCAAGDIEQVFDIMQTEDYGKLQKFAEEMKYPAFVMEGGRGLGIYNVQTRNYGSSMIYYGDFHDELREGAGYWIGYLDGNNYQAYGDWRNDLPEGHQTVREWNGNLNETVSIRQISGTVARGLWDGEAVWEFERKDGRQDSWMVNFTNGKWVILHREEDGEYTVSDTYTGSGESSPRLSTENPDKLQGIEGFLP